MDEFEILVTEIIERMSKIDVLDNGEYAKLLAVSAYPVFLHVMFNVTTDVQDALKNIAAISLKWITVLLERQKISGKV